MFSMWEYDSIYKVLPVRLTWIQCSSCGAPLGLGAPDLLYRPRTAPSRAAECFILGTKPGTKPMPFSLRYAKISNILSCPSWEQYIYRNLSNCTRVFFQVIELEFPVLGIAQRRFLVEFSKLCKLSENPLLFLKNADDKIVCSKTSKHTSLPHIFWAREACRINSSSVIFRKTVLNALSSFYSNFLKAEVQNQFRLS